jgi:hypothetical protein
VQVETRLGQLVSQAQSSTDPTVQQDLEDVEHQQRELKRATSKPPITKDALDQEGVVRSSSLKMLILVVRNLIKVLSIRPKGKAFVASCQGPNYPTTARNLIEKMTPEVLQHNGPELEEVKKALADFTHIDAEYQADLKAFDDYTARANEAIVLLNLSLDMLEVALEHATKRDSYLAAVKSASSHKPVKKQK